MAIAKDSLVAFTAPAASADPSRPRRAKDASDAGFIPSAAPFRRPSSATPEQRLLLRITPAARSTSASGGDFSPQWPPRALISDDFFDEFRSKRLPRVRSVM